MQKLPLTILACLLGLSLSAQESETLYLSGTGLGDTKTWDFYCSAGQNSGKWSKIEVPSQWELQGFGEYTYGRYYLKPGGKPSEETGKYRYSFTCPASWKGKKVSLVFEGSMTDTQVSLNGKSAGPTHQGGFYRFSYDVTPHIKPGRRNSLEVLVSKQSADASVNAAERRADWWLFGGIYRPVYLVASPELSIEKVQIDAAADGTLTLRLHTPALGAGYSLRQRLAPAGARGGAQGPSPAHDPSQSAQSFSTPASRRPLLGGIAPSLPATAAVNRARCSEPRVARSPSTETEVPHNTSAQGPNPTHDPSQSAQSFSTPASRRPLLGGIAPSLPATAAVNRARCSEPRVARSPSTETEVPHNTSAQGQNTSIPPASQTIALKAAEVQTITTSWTGIKPWDCEHPHLYELTLELLDPSGKPIHSLRERIGFRTIEFRERDGFYLNGTKLIVKGVNRHAFYPTGGRTLNKTLSIEDAQLIKSMNMNAVRTHYPPDDHFLSACDSLGLLFMEELAGWHGAYGSEVGEKLLREMIDADSHHPCIFVWSNGNEGGWNTALDPLFAELDLQKRHVVHPWADFGGVDTHHYPAYQTGPGRLAAGYKVFMPTEFLHAQYDKGGGAGLQDFWASYKENPLFAGGFIWAYSDEAVVRSDRGGALDSDGPNGPDGIVGPYREKEGSYYAIREIWAPIQFAPLRITKSWKGEFLLSNDFLFTSLRECSMHYRLHRLPSPLSAESAAVIAQGSVELPDLEPGETGRARMALPEGFWEGDVLELEAFDGSGRSLCTWTWPLKYADEYFARERAASLRGSASPGPLISDAAFPLAHNGSSSNADASSYGATAQAAAASPLAHNGSSSDAGASPHCTTAQAAAASPLAHNGSSSDADASSYGATAQAAAASPLAHNGSSSDADASSYGATAQAAAASPLAPSSPLPSTTKAAEIQEDESSVVLSASGVSARLSKADGSLMELRKGSEVLSLKDGPRSVGMKVEFESLSCYLDGTEAVAVARYKGAWESVEWRLSADGLLYLDALMLNRKSGGGFKGAFFDSNPSSFGLTFSLDESDVSAMSWLGKGPYRVWKNRLPGTNFGIWSKDYNDTITGESFESLIYPEFKGYHAGLYWATLQGRMPFTVYSQTDGLYLRVFTPKEPLERRDGKDVMEPFCEGDLSFLLDIPAIQSYKPLSQQGPHSQRANVRLNSGDEGLHIRLVFALE